MPESGGPTTQSGIYYQNSIAALALGQLLGGGPMAVRRVVAVRAEAPEDVDDTVVTFDDGGRDYIQAKETLPSGDAWGKIWSHFSAQRTNASFNASHDALVLMLGEPSGRANHLREMARRSAGATSDWAWLEALNNDQRDIVSSVERALPEASTTGGVFRIFQQLRVEVRTIEELETERAALLLPETSKTREELLRLLRDRVHGGARYRVSFTREELLRDLEVEDPTFRILSVPALPALRDAVRAASSVLRNQKRGIGPTGRHIIRPATAELVSWLQSEASANTIAMLSDEAGRGKTVVMADVLDTLEAAGVIVLAMKADAQLAGVTSFDDIQRALHLPESVERTVALLAARDSVVVLIDQVDALSHNLARDAKTLDAVLDLAARLRALGRVRVALSCRAFDRVADRRLRSLDVEKNVQLVEFSANEIKDVLASASVAFDALTSATQALLRTPLHLELFVWLKTSGGRPEDTAPAALQDLYAALLTHVALRVASDAPPVSDREQTLMGMTSFMAAHQRPSTPMSHLRRVDPDGRATAWLASQGIVTVANEAATFLHQTLFDYLFARQFVDSGTSLPAHLHTGPQALRQRTELVQILTYARSTVPETYIRWLDTLWGDPTIRPHLRALLLRWFAALQLPSAEDIAWATARLHDPVERVQLLDAFRRNAAWFSALVPVLRVLLHDPEDAEVDAVITFIASVASARPARVAEILTPFIGADGAWKQRLWYVVNWMHTWTSPEAVDFFSDVVAAYPPSGFSHFVGFKEMSLANPAAFARLARTLLDHCVEGSAERNDPTFAFLSHSFDELRQTDFDAALKEFATAEPLRFVDAILPWFVDVLRQTPESTKKEMFFAYDYFAFAWGEAIRPTHEAVTRGLSRALVQEAERAPASFDRHIATLAAVDAASAQWIVSSVFADLPGCSDEALRFLVADPRRLNMGKAMEITMTLIRMAAPHASTGTLAALEAQVLVHRGYCKEDLEWEGLHQYLLLAQFPPQRMSSEGRRRLGELESKFSEVAVEPVTRAPSVQMSWGTAPIAPDQAAKMSDDDWLRAMAKHRSDEGTMEHSSRRLGETLGQGAKDDPTRFAALLDRVPDDTPPQYIGALIQSLGDPAGKLPDAVLRAVRRFAPVADLSLRRTIAWTLQKHPPDVSADALDILEGWVGDPSLDTAHDTESLDYLNPDRGASFQALMFALRAEGTTAARLRRWRLFEYVAGQDANFLRAAAIDELRYELFEDTDRALDMFEALLGDRSELFSAHYVDDFVRLALGRSAARVLPMIVMAGGSSVEEARERAAFLGAIAAVSPLVVTGDELRRAREFVASVLGTEDDAARCAVTRVVARNIDGPAASYCIALLTSLLTDTSEKVRREIATVFWPESAIALLVHREFLEAYVASPAMIEGQHQWEDFLLEHVTVDPLFGLQLIERALPQLDQDASAGFGDDLLRYVLRVLAAAGAYDALERRAMDLFDELDARYGRFASNILAEWDRP